MINFQLKFKDYYKTKGRNRNPLDVYEEWIKIKQDYLDGMSPEDYFESISDTNILVEMLKQYEDDIPPLLIKRIRNFNTDALKSLEKLALDKNLSRKDFYKHGPINAIYILGEMRNIAVLPLFIEIINNCEDTDEIFNYTADAIMKLGEETIDFLIEEIKNTKNEFTRSHLSWILSHFKDERIFSILCELCENAPVWRGFYAEILCDYGDKRAIPILQRLVCEKDFPYEEIDQIERALILLGGEWNWEYEEKGLPLKKTLQKSEKDDETEKKQEEKLIKQLETLQQRKLTEIKQEKTIPDKENKEKKPQKEKK